MKKTNDRRTFLKSSLAALGVGALWREEAIAQTTDDLRLEVERITFGPKHHFFGYIGQSKTIPWNASGRYILTLRTDYHDHMPAAGEAAEICLVDTSNGNAVIPIEASRAWNFQQGTMFYWNPASPETQFFFNDRDPATDRIFTVLYDVDKRERVREYRFSDVSIGNGGVAPDGKSFAAINYGRMARERPVTGYPEAYDWEPDEKSPASDGLFIVNVESGEKNLAISFAQMADAARSDIPDVDEAGLYINHTLWNRNSDTLYFYLRGRRGGKSMRVNKPCTIRADGSGFATHNLFIGGHPEWADEARVIGSREDRQVLYDIHERRIVGRLGTPEIFPKPGGDISLSPDGSWFVNGAARGGGEIRYDFLQMSDGFHLRSPAFQRGPYSRGELRIDPAPRWNRDNDAILVPSWTDDETRQMFVIRVEGEE